MTKGNSHLAGTALLAISALVAPGVQAKYIVVFQEIGGDVDEFGQGSLDLTDLKPAVGPSPTSQMSVTPNEGVFQSGDPDKALELLFGVTGPNSFGPGDGGVTTEGSGDPIGISGMPDFEAVLVSPGYVSGTPLIEGSSYINATFASLGMTPGSYVWSWGSGDHADTFTINIGLASSSVPEPSTWAMGLVGFAGLAYAAVRSQRGEPSRQLGDQR
jgi:PEP-CTERM motif